MRNLLKLLMFFLLVPVPLSCSGQKAMPDVDRAITEGDCGAVTTWWAREGGSERIALRILREMPHCLTVQAARMVPPTREGASVAIGWLMSYGGRTYVPSRDDPAAVRLLGVLRESMDGGVVDRKRVLDVLAHLADAPSSFADPSGMVRREVARMAGAMGRDGEALLVRLFMEEGPAEVALAALDALVRVGLSSRDHARSLVPHLFSVRGGVSWGPLVMAVLASSTGETRKWLEAMAMDVVLRGGEYRKGTSSPPEELRSVYRRARAAGWPKGLVGATFVRLLGMMRDHDALVRLLDSFSTAALAARWEREHATFLEETGQGRRSHMGATGSPSQLHDIESYDRDITIRQALLDELSLAGRGREEMVRGLTFGHDARLVMGAALPLTRMEGAAQKLVRALYVADSWATTSSFYSSVRQEALRRALDDPAISQELVRAWNSSKNDATRWKITRKWWERFAGDQALVEGCAKNGRCLTPTERLREALMEEAWVAGADASSFDASRMVNEVPPVPEGASEDPDFSDVPWSPEVEKARRAAAVAWIRSKKNELLSLEKRLSACRGEVVCLLRLYKKAPPRLQRRILREVDPARAGKLFMWEAYSGAQDTIREDAVWFVLRSGSPRALCSRLGLPKLVTTSYLRLRLLCLSR